ncbi:alpha-amylase family protein [Tautonia rosea]|uniref:hypothetical protein n=1 Tax=Tautonia rosea TaxID=2728037 RepID=UPI00147491B8|nr:hypothetical protein [Tautonia rosea]
MTPNPGPAIDRRSFLGLLGGAAAAASPAAAIPARSAEDRPFVGIQVQPHSFYDEGIDRVLDNVERAEINTLLIYSHLFAAAADVPLETLAPDHGVAPRDPRGRTFRRIWARPTPGLYDGLPLSFADDPPEAEHAGRDLFADLIEPCRRRGIKRMARILVPSGSKTKGRIPGWNAVRQVDLDGRPSDEGCLNNPDFREFWARAAADVVGNNDLDGFMIGAERPGPLLDVVQNGKPAWCFCEHCLARMADAGVDVDRARIAFRALGTWRANAASGDRPAGGVISALLGVFFQYPELLAWEREWATAFDEFVAHVGRAVRTARPGATFGRHIDHQQTSWDIFHRAACNIGRMAADVDFLKPVTYHEIMGPRTRLWVIDRQREALLSELSGPRALDLFHALTGTDPSREPRFEELIHRGFSPDYVGRETSRFVEGADGRCAVYPGIAMDVPMYMPDPPSPRRLFDSDPEGLITAVHRAFDAGATGVIACREYQEMRLTSLDAIGQAVRERTG